MKPFVLCLVLPLTLVCVNSQGCFLPNLPSEIRVQENTPAGTLVLNVSSTDNITVVTYGGSAPFFSGIGGSLYINATIDLDGNETWCRNFADYSAVYVRCVTDGSEKTILPQIELTDDYAPQFKTNFSATIPELTAINTTIVTIGLENIEDKDCQSTVDFSRVRLGLENTANNTFRLQGSNTINVSRLLDFENGDTYFALNVSVRSTQPNDTRVNYALLAVTVTDVDDNDPIFNSTVYSLNVTEENNSFVLVWEETQPPIDAYDQDIQVNDPLKFSLLNPNDEAVLKINETRKFNETIQVQLQRIFDRETEPSKSVVLKVEQVNNPRRSALATLTLHVLDINDNRPLFTQDTYSVSIAEHTAKGSSVVMVTATDADEGENAEFNYTLLAHQDIFDVETRVVGEDRVGVITVKDSAALDRENRSQLQITVGTQEFTDPVGGDCSTGHCNATINVTLTDINDKDPVFPNNSYSLIVIRNVVNTTIGTINATDADEGDNARVTYNMTPYRSVCDFLRIDNTTGDVILIEKMKQSDVCTALVEACDNPSDSSQSRRCTRVPMRVSLPPDVIVNTTTLQADIAENLPKDTIVLQLESYDKAFVMTSSNFFKLENGLVLTRQPLDREEHDKHSLFIETNNMGHTNITVNVTVTDVNDNYPEFLNTSTKEVSLDKSTSVGQVIATVTATDKDVGKNAELTYSLQRSAFSEYFGVDSTSGQISLRQFPYTDLASLDLVVTAADGGTPRLSTIHTIKIFIGPGNGSVRLEAPAPENVLKADKETIRSELSKILGVTVKLEGITQVTPSRSFVYISGKNATTDESLTKDKLQELVDKHLAEIDALFERYRQDENGVFSPALIALIVLSAVLLIALIIAIFFLSRKNKKYKRNSHLIQSLTRHNALYETADLHKVEDGRPILGDTDDDHGSGRGVINPVYQESETSNIDITPRSETEETPQKEVTSGEEGEGGIASESERRAADADSGVPSDKENGGGESDAESDVSKSSPRMEARERSHSEGTSYLDAVLNSRLLQGGAVSADGDDDMVDVTMPPTDYNLEDATDEPEQFQDEPERQPPEEPPVDFEFEEEQETTMTFVENDTGETTDPGYEPGLMTAEPPPPPPPPPPAHLPADPSPPLPPPPPPHPYTDTESPASLVAQDQQDNLNAEEDEEDEDSEESAVPLSGLARAMLAKPPTPPMVHKSRSAEDDAEDEESLPDEPEPDYAKKVRFSAEIIEHKEDDTHGAEAGKGNDSGGVGADGNDGVEADEDIDEITDPGSSRGDEKPIQEIDGPPRELKEDDEPTFHFNLQEEMTAF